MQTCCMFGTYSNHCATNSYRSLPTAYRVKPLRHIFPSRTQRVITRCLTVVILQPNICSPLLKQLHNDKCPSRAASCSGVLFHLSTWSTFAPQSSNRRHIFRCPCHAAAYRAVLVLISVSTRFAPPSSNAYSTGPCLAAYVSGVLKCLSSASQQSSMHLHNIFAVVAYP